MEVSSASFTFSPNLSCLLQSHTVLKLCKKPGMKGVWASVYYSMRLQLSSLFEHTPWCRSRSASYRMCLPWEQRVLFRVGWKALWWGLWDMENLIRTMGLLLQEIMFMCWKGTVRLPRKQGLLHVCSLAVIVRLVSALPVHRGTEGLSKHFS